MGWSGHFSYEEGAGILIDALPMLADLPLMVSLIGDGEERAALEAMARRLGVADRIRWHGELGDSSRLVTAFDCYALTARGHGTPRSLLEAMAAGVPVVAAGAGDVPELVGDDEGLRVPPSAPAALAVAIRDTLTNPSATLERAARARMRVTRDFALAPWVARHTNLYHRILAARPAGAA